MAPDEPSSIQTHASLLDRLRSGTDAESWNEFYRVYGKLVRDFAIRAGLNDAEADDVVQETVVAMVSHLPQYRYDPKRCRFKTWLLNQASWRVKDSFRQRPKEPAWNRPAPLREESTGRTPTVDRVPDLNAADFDALFETEWRKKMFAAGLERVRGKFNLKQLQVFDLLVTKEWPASEVARSLGVSLTNVYVTRHRISAAIKKEIKSLEKRMRPPESSRH